MAKTYRVPVTQTLQSIVQSFVNADGAVGTTLTTAPSNTKLLFTAGTEGAVVKSLMVASDDSSARVFVLYISPDSGTTFYCIGTVNIPVNSGATGAIANIDLFGSSVLLGLQFDQSGKAVLPLEASHRLYGGVQVAVTAAKTIVVTGVAEDY